MVVSIHAPHEGERLKLKDIQEYRKMFQSTLPTRGSDYDELFKLVKRGMFQSTLPTRGSDYQPSMKRLV